MKLKIKLTDILYERQMTQVDLMRKSGLSMGTINGIASGRVKSVSMKTLETLCESLEIPVNELLVLERE